MDAIFTLITGGIPFEKWNWKQISIKAHIETIESLINYDSGIVKLLDWRFVSSNSTLTLEFIDKNNSYPWDYKAITTNKDLILTADFIEKHLDCPWDWNEISTWTSTGRTLYIQPDESGKFNESGPDSTSIDNGKEITLLVKYSYNQWKLLLEKYHYLKGWNWDKLSNSHSIDFIFDRKNWPWNWYLVCRNKNAYTDQIWNRIRENPDLPWDWKGLTRIKTPEAFVASEFQSSKIPLDILLQTEETFYFDRWERADVPLKKYRDFDWKYLSEENRISLNVVDQIPDANWDWQSLSSHKDLTIDFILKYKDKPWCFDIFLVRKLN